MSQLLLSLVDILLQGIALYLANVNVSLPATKSGAMVEASVTNTTDS